MVFKAVFENTYFTFFFRFKKNMTFYVFLMTCQKNVKVVSKNIVLNQSK